MSVIHVDFRKKHSKLNDCLFKDTIDDLTTVVGVLEAAESAHWVNPTKAEVDQLTYLSELCERYLEAYDRIESQLVEVSHVEYSEEG